MVFRRTLLVCTVAALLLSAGCLGPFSPDDGSETEPESESLEAAELVERSQSLNASSGPLHATMTTSMSDGTETQSVTYEVWQRSAGEMRMEVVDADEGLGAPDVMVLDGSTTWMYDEDANRAVRMDMGFGPEEMVEFGEQLNDVAFDGMEAERVGTDTVADRSVTKVELTGNESGLLPGEMTLWIDDETYYPLKQEMEMPGQSGVTMTMTYEEFDPDAELSDDRFTFDPPEDAEVLDFDELPTETHDDVKSADEVVPFDLTEPTVPEAYTLNSSVTMQNLQGWSASLRYTDGADGRLTVTATEASGDAMGGLGGETITIGDVEATKTSTELLNITSTSIRWTTDDLTYTVSGTADEDALRSVAESIIE
ncbi:outer membrane lipoprotein-sorting protein [Halovivax ruber XH-70]|uniref:Outer membrane lipoprotein-sorting protein n=1 Tax=Halovivax ruber (strain DSM 18193 / JCM 13892 / XH-70) TaxID=797302 RepID=L0IFI2_HALRX|nr:outer membrane lipoprotein-sorting protein [Halovivax ruber]AGB16732.1 outer membrane lipoprotein-sorting protein [Halovivax ruber XH-70]